MKSFTLRFQQPVAQRSGVHGAPTAGTRTITEVAREGTDSDAPTYGHHALPRTRRILPKRPFLIRYAENIAPAHNAPTAATKTATAVAMEAPDQDFASADYCALPGKVISGTQTVTRVAQEGTDTDAIRRSFSIMNQ
jgi:hypothetical protein